MDIHQLHRVGYTRVSRIGQNLDSPIDALKAADCKKIFTDKMTGSRVDRPGWDQLMEYVRSGDILVVAELSRMTRSLMHLLETAQELDRKEVNLVSLRENIDTNTATGRCFISMMGAIHQMQRELLRLLRSTERSGVSTPYGRLDLFEGLGKNSQKGSCVRITTGCCQRWHVKRSSQVAISGAADA
jgi:hypothetical protein